MIWPQLTKPLPATRSSAHGTRDFTRAWSAGEDEYQTAPVDESVGGNGAYAMTKSSIPHSALTPDDIQAVSPALANYTQRSIGEDLWKRPGLSPRDRSLVTVSALIAR